MGTVPIEDVYRDIVKFAKEYSVTKLVLFGSRARNTNHEKSDIDIAVYGCKDFVKFKIHIDEELWSLLEIDVINMDIDVAEELKKEIERDGVILYEKV